MKLFIAFLLSLLVVNTVAAECSLPNGIVLELGAQGVTFKKEGKPFLLGVTLNTSTAHSLRCLSSNRAEIISDKRVMQVSLVNPGILQLQTHGGSEISFEDRGEEYYGVWEYPLNGGLSNRGVEREIGTLLDTPHLKWANAKAPFFFTNKGYGIYAKTEAYGRAEFAKQGRTNLMFDEKAVTLSLYMGEPKQILAAYNREAGPSVLPPDWAFGAFWWRNNPQKHYPNGVGNAQENILYDVTQLKKHRIPGTAIWIDRPFMANEWGWGDRKFASFFPDPAKLIRELDREGFKTLLWIANRTGGELLADAQREKLLYPAWQNASQPAISMRNKRGEELFLGYLESFLLYGVRGFKLDRGDENEMPRRELNFSNRYLLQKIGELLRSHYQGDQLLIARAAYDTARKHSIVWSGDPKSTFEGLRISLLAALRAGLILFPFSGSDTGGYVHKTNKELFLRWLAVSAYTPLLEILLDHDEQIFWNWADEETIASTRALVERHHALIPYTLSALIQNRETGVPIMRPLFLEYPGDRRAEQVWDEYLYGESLLVAPVLTKGASSREVYLPAGKWMLLSRELRSYEGQTVHIVDAPLGAVPVFQRVPSVVVEGDIVRGNQTWKENWKPRLRFVVMPPASDGTFEQSFSTREGKIKVVVVRRGKIVEVRGDFPAEDTEVAIGCGSQMRTLSRKPYVTEDCQF